MILMGFKASLGAALVCIDVRSWLNVWMGLVVLVLLPELLLELLSVLELLSESGDAACTW